MQWTIGQDIWIPCSAEPGAFSDERLVVIESVIGPISGFVNEEELKEGANGSDMIRGVIRGVTKDAIEVWVNGSFFTTNGLTSIDRDTAIAA